MSKGKDVVKLFELAQKAGRALPEFNEAARLLAEQKAIQAGLKDRVYHASPHGFATFKPGSDQLIHVAKDPRVALQRLEDIKGTSSPIFDLTPEEAKRLGITKEQIEKSGQLYDLRTDLGNPLKVSDTGDFSLSNLLEDPRVLEQLDEPTKRKLVRLSIDSDALSKELYENLSFGSKPSEKFTQLENQVKQLESQGMEILQNALKEKGFNSLVYKNVVELPKEFAPVRKKLTDIYGELNDVTDKISSLEFKGGSKAEIKKLTDRKEKLQGQIDKITETLPESYALFKDTPLRDLAADFDPKKLKTHPSSILKNVAVATGAGLAGSAMMPEESQAGITYKLNEVARVLDGLQKAGQLNELSVLKNLNYSKPSTARDINSIRMAMDSVLEHGLRQRAGLPMSASNERVNEEIGKILYPELGDIFPVSRGEAAEQLLTEYGVPRAEGMFYSEPTKSSLIPYKGKGIAVTSDSPSLLRHENQHAIESLLYPDAQQRSLAQFFGGKRSNDIFNQTNEDLAKKLSIASKNDMSPEAFLEVLNRLRPEGIGENKLLRKIVNSDYDIFNLGDAGHFVNYPKNFELSHGLELLKDDIKVPKGSLKENEKLIKQIIYDDKYKDQAIPGEIEEAFRKIQENSELVPLAKKNRYTLPDKMPFAIAGTIGAGMLANSDEASAAEMRDPDLPLNIKEDDVELDKPSKIKKPDYKSTLGEKGGAVMNYLTDKLAPLAAKDAENEDYSPIDLTKATDAPIRALSAVGNVADVPAAFLRKHIYNMLSGENKKEASGHDIMDALENKVGAPIPSMPGASFTGKDMFGHIADIGLDPLMIPGGKAVKYLNKAESAAKALQEASKGIKTAEAIATPDINEIIRILK